MNPNDLSNNNPLFPQSSDGQAVPPRPPEPVPAATPAPTNLNPAADLIRQKIATIYSVEPNVKEEIAEVQASPVHRSKHQQFMYELSTSGKSLADIQTQWHEYYTGLPDNEKHVVWQEFYQQHAQANHHPAGQLQAPQTVHHTPPLQPAPTPPRATDTRPISEIKQHLLNNVQRHSNSKLGGHLKSLLFGMAMASIVVVLLLFGFFNERFIAPFVTPSRAVSNTPIIVGSNSVATGPEPLIIIPKINVEIPVVYDEPSIQEAAVENALERGVVHYASTPSPGELGNGVIFGHSSNNILNKGKYKFAFVLLKRLEVGDTFILQKDGKRYVYKVFDKKVVPPSDVSVLGANSRPATFTLITCDPPGTSINRLIITGEQISPDPGANVASSVNQQTAAQPAVLPSNAPTLWHRLTSWISS